MVGCSEVLGMPHADTQGRSVLCESTGLVG